MRAQSAVPDLQHERGGRVADKAQLRQSRALYHIQDHSSSAL